MLKNSIILLKDWYWRLEYAINLIEAKMFIKNERPVKDLDGKIHSPTL